jgi:hypothetical protein
LESQPWFELGTSWIRITTATVSANLLKIWHLIGLLTVHSFSHSLSFQQTIPTERASLVAEVSADFCGLRVLGGQHIASLQPYSQFLDQSRYFFFQAAPQLHSWRWVDPIPDPLLVRKRGSAGNRTWDLYLWICSRELWPLDHWVGTFHIVFSLFIQGFGYRACFCPLLYGEKMFVSLEALKGTYGFLFNIQIK